MINNFNKKNIIEQLTIIRDYEIQNNKPLKVKAYNKVIDNLLKYQNDIKDLNDLKEIKGIGVRILALLTELYETGKISYIENKINNNEYKIYCTDCGNRPPQRQKFSERLKSLGFETIRKDYGMAIYIKKSIVF